MEIVSPSNTQKLMVLKFQTYLEAGVREYWVLEPEGKRIQVYVLDKDRYIASAWSDNDVVPVSVLEPFTLDLKTLWDSK
jgi:Uma2 family endonuclease